MGTKLVAWVLAMTLGLSGYSGGFASQPTQVQTRVAFVTTAGPVTRSIASTTLKGATLDNRTYYFPDGRSFSSERMTTRQDTPAYALEGFELAGAEGVLRWYDLEQQVWQQAALTEGVLKRGLYFISVGQAEYMVCTPQTYRTQANGMIEYLPDYDGGLAVRRTASGFAFTVTSVPTPADSRVEFMLLRSSGPLIDWTDRAVRDKWAGYRFTDVNRWCYDGYYYYIESNYYPYGENYYYNLPAAYIACKMVRDEGQPASAVMGLSMLDVMREQWNADGYVPSLSGSEWLRDDYGIQPGYFDTRFNTELAAAELDAAQNHGVIEWLNDVMRFADFYINNAAKYHFEVGSGEKSGWLVCDYSHPAGNAPTHASLNHHTASAVLLYRLGAFTGNQQYIHFADLMVRGIDRTARRWIRRDGNLHYAFMPDGTMGLGDYPYLTYNDLLALQNELIRRYGQPNDAVTLLMDSKRAWMDANGIRGYNQ